MTVLKYNYSNILPRRINLQNISRYNLLKVNHKEFINSLKKKYLTLVFIVSSLISTGFSSQLLDPERTIKIFFLCIYQYVTNFILKSVLKVVSSGRVYRYKIICITTQFSKL